VEAACESGHFKVVTQQDGAIYCKDLPLAAFYRDEDGTRIGIGQEEEYWPSGCVAKLKFVLETTSGIKQVVARGSSVYAQTESNQVVAWGGTAKFGARTVENADLPVRRRFQHMHLAVWNLLLVTTAAKFLTRTKLRELL
jgi:hypothetical protein